MKTLSLCGFSGKEHLGMDKIIFQSKNGAFENKVVFQGDKIGLSGLITYAALMLCFAALQHNDLKKRLNA